MVQYLNPGLSDHSPLVLEIADGSKVGGRPFRFFNHLVEHPDFLGVISKVLRRSPTGPVKLIWQTLKNIKVRLKEMHSSEYKGVQQRIEGLRGELEACQDMLSIDQ